MTLFFEAEKQTVVECGDGLIKIRQYDSNHYEHVIFLSVNQFEKIIAQSEKIIREALEAE